MVYAARITENNIHQLAHGIREETNDPHSALVYCHEDYAGRHATTGTIVRKVPRLHLKCDKGQSRVADLGDVLIRGVMGEFYAITYEVFCNTYEDVPQEG